MCNLCLMGSVFRLVTENIFLNFWLCTRTLLLEQYKLCWSVFGGLCCRPVHRCHITELRTEYCHQCRSSRAPYQWYTSYQYVQTCGHARYDLDRCHATWASCLGFLNHKPHHFAWWGRFVLLAKRDVWTIFLQLVEIKIVCCHAVWASGWGAVVWMHHLTMHYGRCMLSVRTVSYKVHLR